MASTCSDLSRADPLSLQRFKQEFRVLAGVTHPNLVTLYELISDGESWFFSMEFVQGVSFRRYVRGDFGGEDAESRIADKAGEFSPLRMIRLRRGLAQLVSAVAALHAAGVLHRDIKPSNILVTPDERLVLLDFGLAAGVTAGDGYLSTDANVVGTVAYMSPEQSAGDAITQASDWYSVGVVLYEALTGQLPFAGKPVDVLIAKRQQDAVAPRSLVPEVPEDLDRLCVELLRRDPRQRPAAEAMVRDFAVPSTSGLAGAIAVSASADRTPLVGREPHLATLAACYREMERGHAVGICRPCKGNGRQIVRQRAKNEMVQAFRIWRIPRCARASGSTADTRTSNTWSGSISAAKSNN